MKRKGNLGGIFAMALILVLTLVLSVGSVSAEEPTIVDSGNCGANGDNITWTLDDAGTLTISGEGEMADYTYITDESGEKITTAPWGDRAKTVVIEDGVTGIGSYAFFRCTDMTSVTIPESVTSVKQSAFEECLSLKKLTIPSSVASMGDGAFGGCTGLTEINYNAKAATYGQTVFWNAGTASDGMKVIFGESVEKIPDGLFKGCAGLTSVTIGSNVVNVGASTFSSCTGLAEIYYNAKAAADNSNVFWGSGTAVAGLKVVFGESVEKIPNNLFGRCVGLTSVTIGSNVTRVGERAFSGCTGLKEVIYNAKAVTYNSHVFENAGTAADGMKVVFGESVEKIPGNIFSNCESLTSVTIGSNVTGIGSSAFYGCTGLKEVIYNARAAEYGGYAAFQNAGTASDGMKVIFGENVEKIPDNIFYGCTGLTGVTIGRNVTSIGRGAFHGCTRLTAINYNARRADDLDSSTNAFYDVGAESEGVVVKFGEDVEIIPACLFYTNTSTPKIKIVSVSVGNRVTEIGEWAFCNCVNLTSLELGNSVSTISGEAFGSCKKLSSITGIEGVKQIGYSAFRYCSSLETFTIGENLTRIGANAFYKCIGLKEVYYNAKAAEDLESLSDVFRYAGGSDGVRVIFGEKVKKIPAYLFDNAGNICSFVFTGNPPTVGSSAFRDNYAYALYPVHNSEWTESVREASGSHLTWIGCCTKPVSSAACRVDQTAYLPNDTLNTQGLRMTLTHKDGCTMTIPYDSGLLELGSCDMSTPGAKTIDVTYQGTTAQLKIYVHERKTQTLDKKGYPESSHNYENNLDKTYTYKAAGAVSLDVTFSAQTEVETNIDYLYVNGVQYTGTELAGKTITIQGDTLTIRLVSDKSDSAYGFSIDRIVKTYMEHQYKNGVCTLCGTKDPNYKPAAPTAKASYVGASGKPYIYWGAVDGANRYYVYRSTTKDGTYSFLGSTANLNYTDSKADAGTTYYYKVKAGIVNGVKSDSSAAVAITCRCARPVVKPSYVGASGKPYIYWSAVDGAGKYYVYRSTSKDGTYEYIGYTTKTNYTDSKAVAGTTYYYKVKGISSVKSTANSALSTSVTITCRCARPMVKPSYVGASGKPYIYWGAVDGAGKYYVYRSTSKNGTYEYIGYTAKTNYTDSKAVAGTTYYYKVKAISSVKSIANSALSTPVTITCRCAKPVVKITLTQKGDPKLTWSAVTGASQYEVYRATSKNGTYTKMFTTSNLSYTNTSAKAGTTYYYKVKAVSKVKSTANSAFSTVASIKAR